MYKLILIILFISSGLYHTPIFSKNNESKNASSSKKTVQTYGTVKIINVISIDDGDSFIADLETGPEILRNAIGIRLDSINAYYEKSHIPELAKKATLARKYLESNLKKGKTIELQNVRRDSQFRLRGDLIIDGIDIGKYMLKKEWGVPDRNSKENEENILNGIKNTPPPIKTSTQKSSYWKNFRIYR